jgi:hypothetical protein
MITRNAMAIANAVALAIGLFVGFTQAIGNSKIYVLAENKDAFNHNIAIRCDCRPDGWGSAKIWKGAGRGKANSCMGSTPTFGSPIGFYYNPAYIKLSPPDNSCCQTPNDAVPQINGIKYKPNTKCG